MTAYRRAYLYVAAGISLQILTWGVISLLGNLARGSDLQREAVAFQVAVIMVALPIYLAHWLAIQRRVAGDEGERQALARRVYVYGMLSLWLVPLLGDLHGLLARAIAAAIGSAATTGGPAPGTSAMQPLLAAVVLGVLAFYHQGLLRADGAFGAQSGNLATVRRLFLLGFAALGTLLAAAAAFELFVLAASAVASGSALTASARAALAGGTARLVVGVCTWLVAWRAAQWLYRTDQPGERQSVLRQVYLHLFALASMLAALGAAALLLGGAFRLLLGLAVEGPAADVLAYVLIGACGWLLFTLLLGEDAATEPPGPRQASLARLRRYVVAGIALGVAVVSVAALIQVAVRSALGGGLADALRQQLAWAASFLLVAMAPWVVTLSDGERRARQEGAAGAAERTSAARRVYLYFFLLVATVVVLSAAVYMVFRLIAAALGQPVGVEGTSRLAEAVAYGVVGAGLWLLQWRSVRADEARAAAEHRAREAAFRVAVLDPGGWPEGAAVAQALQEEMPALTVALTGPSGEEANGADVVVAPWPAAGAGALALRLEGLAGTKLLVAEQPAGWGWVGAEPMGRDEIVRQSVHAIRQLVDGQPLSPARRWTPLHVMAALVLALLALGMVVVPIASFVMGGGFMQFLAP